MRMPSLSRLLDRRPGRPADHRAPERAAAAFWRRWRAMQPDVSAALGDNDPGRVEHALCELVAAVHPELQFSLERGHRAIYALVVTGQEDPALRPYTDAWKAAAPADDAIWEYHDSVPPVPDPHEVAVNVGGQRIALAEVRVAARVDGGAVDVAVYHPALAELDERQRGDMTFLPLDATLGERRAAERLRRVERAEAEPAGSLSLLELRELVHRLEDVGEDAGDDGPGERDGPAVGGGG